MVIVFYVYRAILNWIYSIYNQKFLRVQNYIYDKKYMWQGEGELQHES